MKTYKGIVCAKYYQEVEVEANSYEEAQQFMCEQFDLGAADGEVDVYDIEEVK